MDIRYTVTCLSTGRGRDNHNVLNASGQVCGYGGESRNMAQMHAPSHPKGILLA